MYSIILALLWKQKCVPAANSNCNPCQSLTVFSFSYIVMYIYVYVTISRICMYKLPCHVYAMHSS